MLRIATNDRVDREQLLDFVRTRHHLVLVTTRADGRPQVSPVSGGVDAGGRIVISTYPDRAKANNLRRNPEASVLVLSDEWDDAWVQLDGTAEVLDMPSPDAEDGLVEYFRCISGSTRTGRSTGRRCAGRASPWSGSPSSDGARSRPAASRRTGHPPERDRSWLLCLW
jgi:PPOX class probable F420-dependent enzyme